MGVAMAAVGIEPDLPEGGDDHGVALLRRGAEPVHLQSFRHDLADRQPRRDPSPEFDLFIPLMGDLPLKDQRETMERPFFSLQQRKRVKPIEYNSPDGETRTEERRVGEERVSTCRSRGSPYQ